MERPDCKASSSDEPAAPNIAPAEMVVLMNSRLVRDMTPPLAHGDWGHPITARRAEAAATILELWSMNRALQNGAPLEPLDCVRDVKEKALSSSIISASGDRVQLTSNLEVN